MKSKKKGRAKRKVNHKVVVAEQRRKVSELRKASQHVERARRRLRSHALEPYAQRPAKSKGRK